ncbi:unnamed protein product [Durusdinium trenchii]|uniref:Uncharacterized protein n=1 Tax=Durusdinium trenchii TaxID=1381693 RepID=A0ABP0SJ28_9DINO
MLDRDIRHISIQLAGKKDAKQRFVNLKSIEQIYVGQDVAEEIELMVTDLSVTLVLATQLAKSGCPLDIAGSWRKRVLPR